MGELSAWHWLIVFGVAMLLFGSARLPDAARALGRSMRIFRSEMRGIEDHGGVPVVDGSAGAPVASQPGAAGTRGSAEPGGDAGARAE
jgi:sec-independent protein translocase protein TatA